MRAVLAVILAVSWCSDLLANDSEAEIALGGLTLKQSDVISLESEDLFVSRNEVRVNYVFRNPSAKPVETLVAFPLPDQVMDENGEAYFRDFRQSLNFETKVDGKPVQYDIVEQAIHLGEDVTSRLVGLGLPLNNADDAKNFTEKAKALAAPERDKLIAEGLLLKVDFDAGQGPEVAYQPLWNLRMNVTRRQVFPANATIKVQHRYVPLIGGSVGGNWNANMRDADWVKQQRAKFCVEDNWLASFDKAVEKRVTDGNLSPYGETWISYVLASGANWQGSIKDFRLVVDKGKPQSMVSFCGEGVKKISPTQFEVRKQNYEPKDDLNVLILDWSEG